MSKENKNNENETGKMLSELMAKVEKDSKGGKSKKESPQTSERKIPDDFVFVKGDEKLGIDDFYICKHEVTDKEFIDVMGVTPFFSKYHSYEVKDNYPITRVSFFDAIYYCNKRSLQEGLEPVYMFGKHNQTDPEKWSYEPCLGNNTSADISINEGANGYRLPLGKEWDYAARAGENFKYSGGDKLDKVAWSAYKRKGGGKFEIMQKEPNAFGLYDMTGNIYEWCDRKKRYEGEKFSQYPCLGGSAGSISWYNSVYAAVCESDYELDNQLQSAYPDFCQDNIGFRLVLSAEKKYGQAQEIDNLFTKINAEKNEPENDFVLIKPDNTKEAFEALKPFYVCKHLVTERDFFEVMGFIPTNWSRGEIEYLPVKHFIANRPVAIILFDALKYCNKRSLIEGLEPVYIFTKTNEKNPDNWKLFRFEDYYITSRKFAIIQDIKANGYRLLYKTERDYITNGLKNDKKEDIAWFNSSGLMPVMLKKPDSFGLYDFFGNVWEFVVDPDGKPFIAGGSWNNCNKGDYVPRRYSKYDFRVNDNGLRIARSYFE